MTKKLLFRLTKKDFIIQTFRSGGPGGQKQNKVETGVRIIHPDSGARGESRVYRTQLQNRKAAFEKLVNSKEFLVWHKIKCAKIMNNTKDIDTIVEEAMKSYNIKSEIVDSDGNWSEVPFDDI